MNMQRNEVQLIEWLEKLHKEVVSLFHGLQLFRFTRDAHTKNPKLKKGDSTLFHWIMKSASVDLIVKVSRLCEENKNTESLVQFLHKLKREDSYLSRAVYTSLYKNDSQELKGLADRDFDRLAGKGKNCYPKSKIEADIKRLTKSDPCKKITQYRNEYIAHLSKIRNPAPTYNDLFRAAQVISRITKRYYLLLKASNVMSHTPTIQGDWQYPFFIAWMRKKNE